MTKTVSQLVLRPATLCDRCPIARDCGSGATALGCSPDFALADRAGSSILHAGSPDFRLRWAECNGSAFDAEAVGQPPIGLPPYIPQVRRWRRVRDLRGIPVVAVPLAHVSALARQSQRAGCSLKQLLGLTNAQKVIVTGCAHDSFLERVWPRERRSELLDATSALGVDGAVAWGYSVYKLTASGQPNLRPEQLYNSKRSLIVFDEMQDRGITAIPQTLWASRRDLERWADWLTRNPSVTTIAVDLQTADRKDAWAELLADLCFFRSILPPRVHCLVNGVCRVERVCQLRDAWPGASLCNMGPYFSVVFRYKTQYGLTPARDENRRSGQEIFRDVLGQYWGLMGGNLGDLEAMRLPRSVTAFDDRPRGDAGMLPSGQFPLFPPGDAPAIAWRDGAAA